jgi:hypothetical protein
VQLDKHNLRRRCRRKSHTYTKSSNSSYEQARGMGGMAMDPYGSFAQVRTAPVVSQGVGCYWSMFGVCVFGVVKLAGFRGIGGTT